MFSNRFAEKLPTLHSSNKTSSILINVKQHVKILRYENPRGRDVIIRVTGDGAARGFFALAWADRRCAGQNAVRLIARPWRAEIDVRDTSNGRFIEF